jgi:small conductance mechanosensitive channel
MDALPLAKSLLDNLALRLSEYGLKLVGALAVWIIGRAFIKFGLGILVARLEKQKVDHTIVGYARNTLAVALNIALAVVLMGVLGIETASFAAFIAGAGLAIGAAWSGLLSNFAAGAFLVVLRPFKVGDHVTTAGITGTILEVGLFTTTLLTQDNVRTFIGNSKVLGSILRNYHANPTRRIELIGTAHRHADLPALLLTCKEALAATPGVLATPAPEVELISFDATHLKLAIRPYTHPDSYWATLFAATTALLPHLDSLSPTRAAAELEEEDFEDGEGAGESEEE